MKYLILFLLMLFNVVHSNEISFDPNEPLLVHAKPKGYFYLGNLQYIDSKNSPEFGDSMLIQEMNVEYLSGGSYRYRALLKNVRTGISEYYQTRIVNPTNRIKISQVLTDKIIAQKKKVPYRHIQVQLEDGEIFTFNRLLKEDSLDDFTLLPEDILELEEYNNCVGVIREGDFIPMEIGNGFINSRKPFLEPYNTNQFKIDFFDHHVNEVHFVNFVDPALGIVGYTEKYGYRHKQGFEILSPNNYSKVGTVTLKAVQDGEIFKRSIFILIDEDEVEFIIQKHWPWSAPDRPMGF